MKKRTLLGRSCCHEGSRPRAEGAQVGTVGGALLMRSKEKSSSGVNTGGAEWNLTESASFSNRSARIEAHR